MLSYTIYCLLSCKLAVEVLMYIYIYMYYAGVTSHCTMLHVNLQVLEYMYECKVCQKRYQQKVDLSFHISAVHSTNKPRCEFCGRRDFTSRSTMAKHRRKCQALWRQHIGGDG